MKVTVKVGLRAKTFFHFPLTFYRKQGRKCILKEEGIKREWGKRRRKNITKNIGRPFCFLKLFLPVPGISSCSLLQTFIKSSFAVTSRGHDAGFLTPTCIYTWLREPYRFPYVWWGLQEMALHVAFILKLHLFSFHRFAEIKPGCLKVMLNWRVVKKSWGIQKLRCRITANNFLNNCNNVL